MWGVLAAVLSIGVIRSGLQLAGFSANALLVVSGSLLLISVVLPRITDYVRIQKPWGSTQPKKWKRKNEE